MRKILISFCFCWQIDEKLSVEVETNGSIDIAEFKAITDKVSYTLDYKLGSSNMEDSMCISNYNYIDKNDTVKFVVGSIADLERAHDIIYTYGLCEKTKVYVSPVFDRIKPGRNQVVL